MKKIIIHHRSKHHAVNSGYGRLIDFIPELNLVTGTSKFPYRLAKFISRRTNQLAGNYDSSSVLKEIELYQLLLKLKKEQKVVHYLNAERDIRTVVNNTSKFSNTLFCGSFHKPPSVLKKQITELKYLKKLNGVITVGANQVDFLKERLDIKNVQYIPHGVDTRFFKPSDEKPRQQRIIFVGQHLRDFETFNKTIQIILLKFPKLKVDVVLHQAYVKFVEPHASISIYSGINDVELRNLYQKATLLFLPLNDVTACNSILEALACGLPIITSEVGGNMAYLEGSENILVPKSNVDVCVESLSKLLGDENELLKMGASSRKKAFEYEWEHVGHQVLDFYQEISKN